MEYVKLSLCLMTIERKCRFVKINHLVLGETGKNTSWSKSSRNIPHIKVLVGGFSRMLVSSLQSNTNRWWGKELGSFSHIMLGIHNNLHVRRTVSRLARNFRWKHWWSFVKCRQSFGAFSSRLAQYFYRCLGRMFKSGWHCSTRLAKPCVLIDVALVF